MFDPIAIIGDGQMGTVMALVLAEQGIRCRIWCASSERCAALKTMRENKRYLPGVKVTDRTNGQLSCVSR